MQISPENERDRRVYFSEIQTHGELWLLREEKTLIDLQTKLG